MSLDTIFDLASLTKVVATTTAAMQLVEQGTVRLTDPVASWVPGFERFGKAGITVRHLLTHVSGLRPDVDLGEPWKGYEAAIDLAVNEVPTAPPGAQFVYSDINFFLLGHIVARASNEPLEQYVTRHVFGPLGMTDTGFQPPLERVGRIAPTERCGSSTRGRARRPSPSRCAAWCTTPPPAAWAASPATPGCSARPAISRGSPACCSVAARSGRGACCRRSPWPR